MKKTLLLILLVFFGMTFVSADYEQGAGMRGNNLSGSGEQNAANADEGYGLRDRMMAKVGNYRGPQGQEMKLERLQNRFRLKVGNHTADCDCNLTQEQSQNRTRFYAGLSNGRHAEVKVMPDRASETALARLRLHLCENCSLELKEVGKGNESKLAYEFKAKKRARFLGIFNTEMDVGAEVDAENGEVIRTRKPWWAFLASEEDETTEE